MILRESFQQKLEAQLIEWHEEIDKLKAKANEIEATAKMEYELHIQSLEASCRSAQKKLNELQQAKDDAWLDLKSGVEKSWSELGHSIKSAVLKFQ